MTHFVPFHRNTNVRYTWLATDEPTAKQAFALGHAIPESALRALLPGGFGLGTTAQPVPVHRSINVLCFDPSA